MITTIFQFTTYLLALYIIFISISNPQKGLLLYFSTLTTRLYNFQNFPRLLSPQTLDLIIIIILLYRFSNYINIAEVIKSSKFLLLWVISHIVIRVIQINSYPDMSFVQTTSDIVGFYLKLYILYLLIIGFLGYVNDFRLLNKALLINLTIYCGFIYLEYFFGINYNDLYNTVFGAKFSGSNFSQREGLSLVHGPNVHWVSTATFVVSNFSVIFYHYKTKLNFKGIMIIGIFLFTIFIIGARSAIICAIITSALFFLLDSSNNRRIMNIIFGLIFFLIFLFSPYGQYIYDSLNISSSGGLNMSRRLIVQLLLFNQIKEVPIIGYGFVGRHDTDLFQFQEWPEINFIFTEIFDFGILIALITSVFILVMLSKTISIKYSWCNVASYSWIAIILCFISNGNQEYNYYLIPVIFYTYAVWFKKGINKKQVVFI